MTDILLTTLNARFIHASVGLRYLYANLGNLQARAKILEFEASGAAEEIVERILLEEPRIVGFGIYIWNVTKTREVISVLKRVRPTIQVVIGGPEVSYEYEDQPVVKLADYLVTGEADVAFKSLCDRLLSGEAPLDKVFHGGLPDLTALELPYRYYSDSDIANRVMYVEASRGCPFTCEFCLSSIDIPVRQFDHERVLAELDYLYARGARTFKFVDRTFNLNVRTSIAILEFFLARMEPGLFVHFEMVPDRFPAQLRSVVAKFPPGSLQLEIGIQSFDPEVGKLISRRQDFAKVRENLTFLREETSAYIHADLIVGLPGENLETFARGFDTLVGLDPHEIQVGMLKRLKGTPIVRHDEEFQMTYAEDPPYQVLSTRDLSFSQVQEMSRFARYWDLVSNSGNFISSKGLLWKGTTPFSGFLEFSRWLFDRVGQRSGINLKRLSELVFEFVTTVRGVEVAEAGTSVALDYMRGGRNDLPQVLKEFAPPEPDSDGERGPLKLKRQSRTYAT